MNTGKGRDKGLKRRWTYPENVLRHPNKHDVMTKRHRSGCVEDHHKQRLSCERDRLQRSVRQAWGSIASVECAAALHLKPPLCTSPLANVGKTRVQRKPARPCTEIRMAQNGVEVESQSRRSQGASKRSFALKERWHLEALTAVSRPALFRAHLLASRLQSDPLLFASRSIQLCRGKSRSWHHVCTGSFATQLAVRHPAQLTLFDSFFDGWKRKMCLEETIPDNASSLLSCCQSGTQIPAVLRKFEIKWQASFEAWVVPHGGDSDVSAIQDVCDTLTKTWYSWSLGTTF